MIQRSSQTRCPICTHHCGFSQASATLLSTLGFLFVDAQTPSSNFSQLLRSESGGE